MAVHHQIGLVFHALGEPDEEFTGGVHRNQTLHTMKRIAPWTLIADSICTENRAQVHGMTGVSPTGGKAFPAR